MMIDNSAWKVDDPDWSANREKQWKTEGLPILTGSYMRGGSDMTPAKAELVKKYFFSGELAGDNPFPFFYTLRFYPGDDPNWFEDCLFQATDWDLCRFIVRYSEDSLDRHNQYFTDYFFSERMTKRLAEALNMSGKPTNYYYLSLRDLNMVKAVSIHRRRALLGSDSPLEPDHYHFKLGERWLQVAQDYESRGHREDQSFVKYLKRYIYTVGETLDLLKKGEIESSAILELAIDELDKYLRPEHGLREYWEETKANA